MRKFFAAVAGVCLLATPLAALAGGAAVGTLTVLDNCQNQNLKPDDQIEACTQLIHANLAEHKMLAAFYAIRANAYFRKKDMDGALADYDKAIDLFPDFRQAFYDRGLVLEAQNKFPQALHDIRRAAQIDPTDMPVAAESCRLGSFLWMAPDDDLASCDAALKLMPQDRVVLLLHAFALLRIGKCPEAEPEFTSVLNVDDRAWGAWYGRGVCEAHRGDINASKQDIAKAAELNPDAARGFASMGIKP
jgi:tetratricopeptide (TPR) repeat protein